MVKVETSMATLDSTAVWDPGLCIHAQRFAHKRLISNSDEPRCSYFPEFIYKYEGIWRRFNKGSISLSTMRDELEICEQEILKQNWYDIYLSIKNVTESITTLLHIFHVFSVSSQDYKKSCVLPELTIQLAKKSESDLYHIYNEYIDQLMTSQFRVTEEDLCIREIDPYYELQLKLCYGEKLIKQEKYKQYQEFMSKNIDFEMSIIKEMKRRKAYKTMSQSCIYFLHLLNSVTICHQPGGFWNKEELICILTDILSILPKGIVYGVFGVYLEQVERINPSIRFVVEIMTLKRVFEYLHSIKIDTYLNLLFKLFWCKKLINGGHANRNIVNICLNDFCSKKCQENKAEFTVQLISITDNLSDTSFLKEFLQCYFKKNIKTVTSMVNTKHGCERSECNKSESVHKKSEQDLIYTQCASILSGNKMKNVDIQQYSRKFNMKGPADENELEMQSEKVKLLILFILLLLLTALGHKSAKLKKYLALKYEYDMASLYLLWCSGDIEVHPGPPWRRKQLEHNSERERKWLQDINSILLKLYLEIPTQSKPKNLWQKDNQPEQWPSDKPFYDTKNASKDAEGNKITDDEILTCLLECLKKKKVDIPQIYQSEISAWTNKNIQLLHKLQVYRIEMENVKSASFTLYSSNLEGNTQNLQNIKVSLEKSTLDKILIEGLLNNDLRQKKQAEIIAEITRDLANTLCRLAKGIDPMEKGDGTWHTPPPVNWPEDVPFFNPKNRGKNKDKPKCPDTVLVCTFLKLQHLRIPENLQQKVDAYQTMYNCTDTEEKKKNKEKLCRLYTIQSNLEKLDCSLQNLHKEGLFSREVHGILNQWWKTQSVDEHAEHVLKNAILRSAERPHIKIEITKGIETDADLKYTSYTIPIKDAYLHIKCKTVHPNQSSQEQTLTGSLVAANNSDNIEDSVLPPDVIDFALEHDIFDQTKWPNNNVVMITENRPIPFDLQRQGTPLPITYLHLKPQNNLDILTTHNTLASDLNVSRHTTEYVTNVQACNYEYNSRGSTGENLGGNMGTSTAKRKQLENKEEPAKKLFKIKVNQYEHYDRIDGDSSSAELKKNGLSLEQNPNSTSNLREMFSDNVLDSWSLDFSMADRNSANSLGATCECKNSEDIQSCKQICNLENLVHQNQQCLPENIDEVKNNDNQNDQIEDDKELESFSDLENFISGKPSQMETDLL